MKVLAFSLGLFLSGQDPGLTPFLMGTSHPEIARPFPSPTELAALRGRVLGLLGLARPPGVQETRDLAHELVQALVRRELGYIDAAFAVTRVRDTLSLRPLDENIIKAVASDLRGRFADTPLSRRSRDKILRGVREVLSSAKNELP